MSLPDFLTQDASGEIRFTGHRIGLYHLVHYYNEGYSPEMLVGQYPTLTLSLVHRAIAFYLDNRAEVDAYVGKCQEESAQQRTANPRRVDVEALRLRLEAQRKAEVLSSAERP